MIKTTPEQMKKMYLRDVIAAARKVRSAGFGLGYAGKKGAMDPVTWAEIREAVEVGLGESGNTQVQTLTEIIVRYMDSART